ncbi:acyl-CoA dehydrogenase family protein [Fimbriimonas ginsengisoli]|uniref:Putative acyl-CoA Dehydrogenase n=1 Tax=Fimbriimonas ginsengisoli Gsoil 348 TaxID=661478 RepID=A0A068NU26_FIMGI|nr:acyl-CoA dehydrogenase family protein [Fimbriimonas ginsengisoli]AIE86946.1 putative acyl-CoA Dehydrogenase [Fimbriimonas ginsengisoli Gsoil 348]
MRSSTIDNSSPAGCAFFSTTPDSIFTPEQFVGDEALMIRVAEEFSRGEVLPLVERLDHQEEGLMPGLIRQAGDLGLCGVDSPDEFGGLGLGKNLAARILEFMSLNGSFSVTYGITSGISQVGLSLFGTDEQKAKYLPRLTSGEWIGAYALSEPNSGSDALSATTRADLRDGKYVLNGTKMWISNAKWADLFLVLAKIDGDKFSAFLVEKDFPGVSVSREEHKMGLKGSSTARLVLENAEVPQENLLHQVGQGHHVAFNALNIGRFKLASMSIGPARDAMGLAAAYALDRKQFGQSISTFGLIQKKFAMMAAWFYAAESMIYRTGALIDSAFDEYGGTVDGNRKAAEEYAIECSACKVFATEAESLIVDEALQVYGGYGFTEEFPIARHYRDARVSRIYEGTNEINRLFIADRLRRRIKDGRVEGAAAGDSFISELAGKAIDLPTPDQISTGALSDLLMLAYAEQSARLRAKQVGGVANELYTLFLPWANSRAAEAYQTLTGASVTLPAAKIGDNAAIADVVYAKRGPAI